MKLSELVEVVNALVDRQYGRDLEVAIRTRNGGVPHARMVSVKNVHEGFDWTAPYFIVEPAEPVVVVRDLPTNPREAGKDRLFGLKQAYAGLSRTYIPRAREAAWLDGFVEGVNLHVTACADEATALAHRQKALLELRELLVDGKSVAEVRAGVDRILVENDQKLERGGG